VVWVEVSVVVLMLLVCENVVHDLDVPVVVDDSVPLVVVFVLVDTEVVVMEPVCVVGVVVVVVVIVVSVSLVLEAVLVFVRVVQKLHCLSHMPAKPPQLEQKSVAHASSHFSVMKLLHVVLQIWSSQMFRL
jgi:hypothetical protein